MPGPLRRLLQQLLVLICAAGLTSGCVSSGLAMADTSPWHVVPLETHSSPLDIAFTDSRHGLLVGTDRLVLETDDGGSSWQERVLDLPDGENFRLISIAFNGDEGWIAGQPGLVLHSNDGGQRWSRLLLDTRLPGEPYLVTARGPGSAELATTVGAIYVTTDAGQHWDARVGDAVGAVRDLRRSDDGRYVSVSSLGNFYASWEEGQSKWMPHQRLSSQRIQTMGFQPSGDLWMLSRGAQIRFADPEASMTEDGGPAFSRPIIPITNGYGYLDMGWGPDGSIWTGGGSGTLLISEDGGQHWQQDPIGEAQPTNFTRIKFLPDGKGFVMGERGSLLRWAG